MPTSAIYLQSDFPEIFKWQALAFMRVEWADAFVGEDKFITETYPIELQPLHFVVAEGEVLITFNYILLTNRYKAYPCRLIL